MPPIKFRLNLIYGLRGDVVCRISRWPPWWRTSWISERILNLCITVMLLIKFWLNPTSWELSFLEFQDGRHLGYRNGTILSILNLCVTVMPPIQFQLNRTYGLEGDVF